MIEILPSPPHLAAFQFSGTLDGDDYDRCIAEIEARLAAHPRIGLYADMSGFSGMTAAAVGKDLRYAIEKLGDYDRFARGAVVTEREWLGKASELVGKLFPGTEVRAFAPGEQAQALQWAADIARGAES
ncbi:STAS/SEC14 domain-containing protein [Luteimonas sp. RD2P54]|uniref:STAS/SEC14 domain-containing protein n=1 Tax=Luteimonas endophytica TaxID=3042023 RepID=A0ABT6JAM4_9GAMM|nr:STAS/SEC14 domain-containing protein [Luteimonas endophytica]MDH5823869.1 STAS/SEC14 domain-containing protein [Luteimonas endophytica]